MRKPDENLNFISKSIWICLNFSLALGLASCLSSPEKPVENLYRLPASEGELASSRLFQFRTQQGDCLAVPVRPNSIRGYVQKMSRKGEYITTEKCNPQAAHQQWELVQDKRGYFTVESQNESDDRLCMSISGESKEEGVRIYLWPCGDAPTQNFKAFEQTLGPKQITSVFSGLCVTVTSSFGSDKKAVVQRDCQHGTPFFFDLK